MDFGMFCLCARVYTFVRVCVHVCVRACVLVRERKSETSDCAHAVVPCKCVAHVGLPTVVCHSNCVPLSFFREGKMFTCSAKAGSLNTFPFGAGEVDIVIILTS